jgi:hypothetical protein
MVEPRKCTVYDVREKDPSKKVIGTFDTMNRCGHFLGLSGGHVREIIKNKTRNKTNRLNKEIPIR